MVMAIESTLFMLEPAWFGHNHSTRLSWTSAPCGCRKTCRLSFGFGGLLVGAVVNMRPELYRVAVAHVPFVDVVTTMLDESIPLTTNEFDEWGNPKRGPDYEYMLSYSPYDYIVDAAYPAMLVTTGLWDSQVQYFEPAKWVAKLRAHNSDRRHPLILHTNMEAGHGGASGRFRRLKQRALEYAFVLRELKAAD